MRSPWLGAKDERAVLDSSRFACGEMKGLRTVRIAAMVRQASRQPKVAP